MVHWFIMKFIQFSRTEANLGWSAIELPLKENAAWFERRPESSELDEQKLKTKEQDVLL